MNPVALPLNYKLVQLLELEHACSCIAVAHHFTSLNLFVCLFVCFVQVSKMGSLQFCSWWKHWGKLCSSSCQGKISARTSQSLQLYSYLISTSIFITFPVKGPVWPVLSLTLEPEESFCSLRFCRSAIESLQREKVHLSPSIYCAGIAQLLAKWQIKNALK